MTSAHARVSLHDLTPQATSRTRHLGNGDEVEERVDHVDVNLEDVTRNESIPGTASEIPEARVHPDKTGGRHHDKDVQVCDVGDGDPVMVQTIHAFESSA